MLALQGEHEEALELLQQALQLSSTEDLQAHNAAWIAHVMAARGDTADAGRYLALAAELDPACYSIEIVDQLAR